MDLKTGAWKLFRWLNGWITDHVEESFPILMIILGGIGLIAVAVGWWLLKIIGLLAIAYAVREIRRRNRVVGSYPDGITTRILVCAMQLASSGTTKST